jgi:hypothetical protein
MKSKHHDLPARGRVGPRHRRARSASFFASDENMTSGSNHVVVAARFADGSGWVILDTYV